MALLKILIVEDEIFIADYLQEMLEVSYEVIQANTVTDAITALAKFQPDIVLMDINLEGNSEGIMLAQNQFSGKKIIFLTAQNDIKTIEKAIATNPETYLTKPIKKIDLLNAIKIIEFKNRKNTMSFKDGFDVVKLDLSSILYIKSDGNYVDIFTTSKKYSIRQSLDTILEKLETPLFKKVHRSYIVNTSKITKKKSTSVFINDIEIPISRNINLEL